MEQILEHHTEVDLYAPGSMGPKAADRLAADVGGWLDPEPPKPAAD